MLVMTAILLVVLIGLGALAIDVGSFYQAKRQAQAAADAGALAGADALVAGASASSATSTATTLANTNYPSTTSPTATVNGKTITVSVANTTPAYFGQIFGVSNEKVGARAVATATSSYAPCGTPGNSCYAVFAMDPSCSTNGVTVNAGNVTVLGGVHSNGSFLDQAGNDHLGPTTYGTGCTSGTNSNDTFTSGPTAGPAITSWPIDYSATFGADCGIGQPFTCSLARTPSYCTQVFYQPTVSLSPVSAGGIYCFVGAGNPSQPRTWNGAVTLTGSSNATIIAGQITNTAAGSASFTPDSTTALLFYATQPGSSGAGSAIYLNAGGSTYGGHLFAPLGTIDVAAGGNTTSFLEAKDVVLEAGNMTITGSGPQVPSGGSNPNGIASLTQ